MGMVVSWIRPPESLRTARIYDAIQRGIVYNHAALGPSGWGRQGATVALKFDAGDAVQQTEISNVKETIDGKEYTVGTPEHLAAL